MAAETVRISTSQYNVRGTLSDSNGAFGAGSYIDITPAASGGGSGFIQIGNNQEYSWFTFTATGVVTLVNNTANVVTTQTDAKLVIKQNGSAVRIVNELGSTLNVSGYYILNG